MHNHHSPAAAVALALGKGILAGIAGTVAITLSQLIEMKITKRKPSDTPAKAVKKVLHIRATDEAHRQQLVQEVHWTYGSLWGLGRGVLGLAGMNGWPATAAHFAAIWSTEMVMLPSIGLSQPPTKWGAAALAKDGLHHLVYAVAAGLVFDTFSERV